MYASLRNAHNYDLALLTIANSNPNLQDYPTSLPPRRPVMLVGQAQARIFRDRTEQAGDRVLRPEARMFLDLSLSLSLSRPRRRFQCSSLTTVCLASTLGLFFRRLLEGIG